MTNSTARQARAKSRRSGKEKKPAHKFPLWLHAGQWAKKIRGTSRYFGKDKDAALKEYTRVRDDLEAGREPPPAEGATLTIKRLFDAFLTFKQHQVALGELSQRTWCDYQDACQRMADYFGKNRSVESLKPDDLLHYRQRVITLGYPTTRTWFMN